jgi:hypothetical protein
MEGSVTLPCDTSDRQLYYGGLRSHGRTLAGSGSE